MGAARSKVSRARSAPQRGPSSRRGGAQHRPEASGLSAPHLELVGLVLRVADSVRRAGDHLTEARLSGERRETARALDHLEERLHLATTALGGLASLLTGTADNDADGGPAEALAALRVLDHVGSPPDERASTEGYLLRRAHEAFAALTR